MASDALSEPFAPREAEPGVEPHLRAVEALDRTLPKGVTRHPSVDWEVLDPCRTGAAKRQCVAVTKAGQRCSAPALTALVLCSAHAGRLDARAGGRARAKALRDAKDLAETRFVEARLGTRAVVASALAAKHAEIRSAISALADMAAEGDRQAALALIPWINQGLGMPGSVVPLANASDNEARDLRSLSTAELRALLMTPASP
jgi:hypothetical protein